MDKKRWIAWALALFMVATPCMTFAQEISGAAGSTNESESNEPVNPDKASEPDRGDAVENEKGDSSVESVKGSEEGATGEQDSAKEKKTEESADAEASKEAAKAAENTGSKAVSDKWTTADFTYGEYEKLMYGCDYSRQFYVRGKVITGFSKQGEEKLKSNKNLVIPAKGPDGKNIVGIGESAFKEKSLESVQFPTGMLTPYDDPLAKTDEERVSRRGNFVIGESSFYGNKLKEVVLPTGVISVLAKAFERNQIVKVKLPKTIWWIENQGFADNKITDVQFPVTTDFMMELHGMPFAFNNIKSVRLPNFTDKDGKLAELPNAARDGYTFEGWFTAAEGGDAVTADTVFDKDTTVFAHWKKNVVSATPSVKLSTSTYTYNGKVKTPGVKVSVNGTVLTKDNYSVSYGKGRKNVGKYTVKVTLKNDYAGSKTVSFKINPPKSAVKKLKKGKKSFTVYVKKQSKQTSGYQVQYSTSKKFKSPKTKSLTSYKKTSLKVKKLKKHKKYYVRVRTYKKVGKAKYYSSWSSAKSVKTK